MFWKSWMNCINSHYFMVYENLVKYFFFLFVNLSLKDLRSFLFNSYLKLISCTVFGFLYFLRYYFCSFKVNFVLINYFYVLPYIFMSIHLKYLNLLKHYFLLEDRLEFKDRRNFMLNISFWLKIYLQFHFHYSKCY